MKKIKKYAPVIFLSVLALGVAGIWHQVFYFETHQNLIVSFFDIGQGDSIFIEAPDGNQILIDGGPSDAVLAKLGSVMPFWDRSIDLVILTHAHVDHVAGLVEVLKRYRVDRVLESGEAYSTPEYQEWHNLIQEKNIPVTIAAAGEEVRAGVLGISVLSPFENENGVSFKNPHDANVSARLAYGSTSVLFMGDAEKQIEYRLAYEHPGELSSDILKVGHHGSKTSTSEEFVKRVRPKFAVISVGRKNRYGHPNQQTLDTLQKFSISVLRTDLDGDVSFVSNGVLFLKQKD